MQQQQSLRDFLDLEAKDELHMFIQGNQNKTPQMKYNTFVKRSLEKFNPLIRNYVEVSAALFRECKTVTEIEKIKVEALPPDILNEIIDMVDKQKILNIVEKVYLFLDLTRAVTSNIGSSIGKAAMHYAKALQMVNDAGGRIVGLNGQPLKGK